METPEIHPVQEIADFLNQVETVKSMDEIPKRLHELVYKDIEDEIKEYTHSPWTNHTVKIDDNGYISLDLSHTLTGIVSNVAEMLADNPDDYFRGLRFDTDSREFCVVEQQPGTIL